MRHILFNRSLLYGIIYALFFTLLHHNLLASEHKKELTALRCQIQNAAGLYSVPKHGSSITRREIIIEKIFSDNPILIDVDSGQSFNLVKVGLRSGASVEKELEFMRVSQHVNENFTYDVTSSKFTYTIIIDLHDSYVPFKSDGICSPVWNTLE